MEGLVAGGLKRSSNVRPNRLFTADKRIILYKVGTLKKAKVKTILRAIRSLFTF